MKKHHRKSSMSSSTRDLKLFPVLTGTVAQLSKKVISEVPLELGHEATISLSHRPWVWLGMIENER